MLVTGEVYHALTRSIANFKIFNNEVDFSRMKDVLKYYQFKSPLKSFSAFNKLADKKLIFSQSDNFAKTTNKLVKVIAWCLMPTHIHLVLKQSKDGGISRFMNNILNSYSRYFNIKHNRKGPLWEGRFKKILVESDEQLLHLTRYIHLNPVTAGLIDRPEDWPASSYGGYVVSDDSENNLCCYHELLDINPATYKKFVDDRISYQKELIRIKHLAGEEV
ncbi:MAG: transposase [Candidatus Omnitrophota bacterium]|jgi:putative transposase